MYENNDEIQQKLADCVISYKNKPFYVVSHGSKNRSLQGCIIPDFDNKQTLSIDDPDLDFRNLGSKLGYINFDTFAGRVYKEASYSMRIPVRKVHQGLCRSNVHITGLKGDGSNSKPGYGSIQFDTHVFSSASFTDTFMGKFPTLKSIKSEFAKPSDGVISRAFDRRWAISKTDCGVFGINYKYETVGYTEDFSTIKIQERFKFLKPDLREIVKEEIKVA